MFIAQTMDFPVLYDTTKSGAQKQWQIKVTDDGHYATVSTIYGKVGGALQTKSKIINKGKNIGRANETTVHQQALSEAQSAFDKKLKEGYHRQEDTTETSNTILPMLALDFNKRSHDIVFPCFIQPKIDGVRAVYHSKTLWSRNGNPFTGLQHILDALKDLPSDVVLDGELYVDPSIANFQTLVGLVKKSQYSSQEQIIANQITYIVYDIVEDLDFEKRMLKIRDLNIQKPVLVLDTWTCHDSTQIQSFLDQSLQKGFEGIMIRNRKGIYLKKNRSANLQKLKPFETDEFEIVGFDQGVGQDAKCIIFTCKTPSGNLFNVRPRGSVEYRKKLFSEGSSLIGKSLTIRYQNLIEGSGVPRFCVGIAIRDYE